MKLRFSISIFTLRKIILVLLLVVIAAGAGYGVGVRKGEGQPIFGQPTLDRTIPEGKPASFTLFWQVWDDLHRLYVDRASLKNTDLVYGAIKGMVAAAGDPYTAFLTPDENKETTQDLQGNFGGVGIELGYKDNTLAVIAPLAGTPAEKAGIKAGDLIVKITDEKKKIDKTTEGISLPDAVNLIRGDIGTPVVLTVVRSGVDKPFPVTIVRGNIVVKTVELSTKDTACDLGPKCVVPVIKISRFGETTDTEWDAAVAEVLKLKDKGNVPGIILDLRNDPGGYLDQAVNLASDFIPSGTVVWQQDASGMKTALSTTRSARLAGVRLVVLINEGSASAAEILAGALSEKANATLVGVTSFGKGSVQQPEDLPDGSGLHVTVAKWLLPSGKSIDKVGIKPNIEVQPDQKDQTNDVQLTKAVAVAAGLSK